ncbi:hypothetical protein [Salinisphaera aquimarina]|uniref:Uncharacterized protein n=1 Tax=Salinisphaera aquimarina TaxID=2094031 RepID=A0ABV7EUM3_9GAMM
MNAVDDAAVTAFLDGCDTGGLKRQVGRDGNDKYCDERPLGRSLFSSSRAPEVHGYGRLCSVQYPHAISIQTNEGMTTSAIARRGVIRINRRIPLPVVQRAVPAPYVAADAP